jgi:hypothetical protein
MEYGEIKIVTHKNDIYISNGDSLVLPNNMVAAPGVQMMVATALANGDGRHIKQVTVDDSPAEYSHPAIRKLAEAVMESSSFALGVKKPRTGTPAGP